MTHLVQIQQPDGSLPADGWREYDARTPSDAAITHVKAIEHDFVARPSFVVAVSLGTCRHANGTPMNVLILRFEAKLQEAKTK